MIRLVSIAVLALACGCAKTTEVLVHIASDYSRDEVPEYAIRVDSEAIDERRLGPFVRASDPRFELPTSFGLTPKTGELDREVTIFADAYSGGALVQTATRTFAGYVSGETRHVCVFLARRCHKAEATCTLDSGGVGRCGRGGCEPRVVAPSPTVDPACAAAIVEDAGVVTGDAGKQPPDDGATDAGIKDGTPGDADPADDGATPPMTWWDATWRYRLDLTVATGTIARVDYPIEREVDFAALLEELGETSSFDAASPRVVERTIDGSVIAPVPAYYHADFSDGRGVVIFLMRGLTPRATERYFSIYFDAGASHERPPEWIANDDDVIGNGELVINRVGFNARDTPVGIGLGTSDLLPNAPNVQQLYERTTRIRSTATPQVDYAGDAHGTSGAPPAPNSYPGGNLATIRMDTETLRIIESEAALPELDLVELIIITSGWRARFHTRFVNRSPNAINDLIYYEAIDADFAMVHQMDRAGWDAPSDVVWSGEGDSSKGRFFLGVRGVSLSLGHDVATPVEIWNNSLATPNLQNRSELISADVAFVMAWAVPPLPAGGASVHRSSLAVASTQVELFDMLVDLSTPPEVVRTALVRRP